MEEGTVTAWGLSGKYRLIQNGGDFKSITDLGKISWQDGRVGGQRWRRNQNGLLILQHDGFSGPEGSWPGSYHNYLVSDLKLIGETTGTDPAYVVEANPARGSLEWLFFDKNTHLLTRTEEPSEALSIVAPSRARYTYVFSDFRKSGKHVDAWRERSSDGIAQNDVVWTTTSLRYDVPVTADETAMPPQNYDFARFSGGHSTVALQARMISQTGHIRYGTMENPTQSIGMPGNMSTTYSYRELADKHFLVKVSIKGAAYDFMLDSGSSGIFIDSEAVQKLGLESFGPVETSPDGQRALSYSIIPDLRAGDIVMNNVIATTLPAWVDRSTPGTDIIGLLGYDFIANAVLAIDYEKATVTAINPLSFVPPADGIALPATLDDGVPFITVQIGQSTDDHFILDTGSSNCFVFERFAQAHAADIKDQGKGIDVNRIWLPFYGFVMPGDVVTRSTEVQSLNISGISLNEWLMFTLSGGLFTRANEDGLIGYDFLQYFTVYLDYPQNEIFLVPNELGKKRAGL